MLLDYLTTRQEISHHEGWVRIVARRKALRTKYSGDRGRRHDPLALDSRALDSRPLETLALHSFEPDAVLRIEISRLFARMRPGDGILWWHRRVLGVSFSELEQLQGASVSTLKRRLRRIERSLRRNLDSQPPRRQGEAGADAG